MRLRLFQSILAIATLSLASSASAHFELDMPAPASNDENGGKGGPPCGPDASTTANLTAVMGGSMLPIMIRETTAHPGHYRVVLVASRGDLSTFTVDSEIDEPVVKNADGMVLDPEDGPGNSETAEIMNPPVFPVLADGLFAHTATTPTHSGMVAIPNMNCPSCTLQVIEFMSKHAPDYFYRHCANLNITADPNKPLFDPSGMGGSGGGGAGGGGGSGGMAGSGGSGGVPGAGGTQIAGTSSGGTAVGTGGMPVAGSPSGGTPTGGTGIVAPANTTDDSSCTVSSLAGTQRSSWAAACAGLLLGLSWLARRRKRPG